MMDSLYELNFLSVTILSELKIDFVVTVYMQYIWCSPFSPIDTLIYRQKTATFKQITHIHNIHTIWRFTYDQFLSQGRLLTDKLMLQGFLHSRLMSAFRKFYGRYNDLIYNYKLSLSHMLSDIFIPIVRPYLAHWPWQRITPHSWS
jgi:hypothetical protein